MLDDVLGPQTKEFQWQKKKERGTHCWALKFFILLLYEGVCPLLKHCSDVLFGQEGEEYVSYMYSVEVSVAFFKIGSYNMYVHTIIFSRNYKEILQTVWYTSHSTNPSLSKQYEFNKIKQLEEK